MLRFIQAGLMGAIVGGLGVVAHSVLQLGRLPPPAQAGGAAAFMGTMFSVGTFVRQR